MVDLPGLAQRPVLVQEAHAPQPSASAYSLQLSLSQEVAQLLRRAMAQPNDTKAIATIESKETVRLMERAQQLRPAFTRWLNTLSTAQREELMQRFMKESALMQCVDSLEHDPRVKTRFKRSPNLENAVQGLLYQTM